MARPEAITASGVDACLAMIMGARQAFSPFWAASSCSASPAMRNGNRTARRRAVAAGTALVLAAALAAVTRPATRQSAPPPPTVARHAPDPGPPQPAPPGPAPLRRPL